MYGEISGSDMHIFNMRPVARSRFRWPECTKMSYSPLILNRFQNFLKWLIARDIPYDVCFAK